MHNIVAAALGLLLWCGAAMAQETVHFASLDGATELDGYLYRPAGEGRHPAVVGLHAATACSAAPPASSRRSIANGRPS
jgi:dienelactone hydrolase